MSNNATFHSLGVSEETQRALKEMGYEEPTEVQKETIPLCFEGHDLVVQSRTGTGKTASFGVPIIEEVVVDREEVQALVLTPTRELTVQVRNEVEKIASGRGIKVQSIYGGDSVEEQVRGIEAGAQVVVGTPGRVLDLLKREWLRLGAVRYLVLDEADKMLDMGFAQEMGEIMRFVPEKRQTLLFSATIPLGIRGLIYNYLTEPEWVLLSEDFAYVKEVRHSYIITPQMQKTEVLERLLECDQPSSSMIFCNTRDEVRTVATVLERRGLPVAMISSDLTQRKREQVMSRFRSRAIRHLVATDVAARGIDVDELSHVFIYSTPDSAEAYIHRAGRTGRIGRGGDVVSLVAASDLVSFNRLANRYHLELTERTAPTDEEVASRKMERLLRNLVDEAKTLSPEAFEEAKGLAEEICNHEDRLRLVAHLLQRAKPQPKRERAPAEREDANRKGRRGRPGRRRRRRGGPKPE